MHRESQSSGHQNGLDEVLAEYMRRVDRGEPVDREALIAAHPKLAVELRAYFSQAVAVDRFAAGDNIDTATFARDDSVRARAQLAVRCPSCHAPVDLDVDTPLTDVTCSSCGSQFSLINEHDGSQVAPPLAMLGRFELIARLGMGAFGSVWKACDKELDRTCKLTIPKLPIVRLPVDIGTKPLS